VPPHEVSQQSFTPQIATTKCDTTEDATKQGAKKQNVPKDSATNRVPQHGVSENRLLQQGVTTHGAT